MALAVSASKSAVASFELVSTGTITPMGGGGGRGTPGDLMVAVACSQKDQTGYSSGWTALSVFGVAGARGRAFWRIADGSTMDQLTVTTEAAGFMTMGLAYIPQGSAGFDASVIVQQSGNASASVGGASYALSSALTSVSAGQLSILLGGDMEAAQFSQNASVSGTSWAEVADGNAVADGHCVIASNSVTGVPANPSVTYSATRTNTKFVWAGVIREQTPSGMQGGLFWGAT